MPISALSLSALEKRWASKAFRAAEASLEKHFSDLIRDREIRYHARLHQTEPEVRLAPDFDGIRTFEISFNGSDWETVEDAVPKAFE